jgi:hypothetical protein
MDIKVRETLISYPEFQDGVFEYDEHRVRKDNGDDGDDNNSDNVGQRQGQIDPQLQDLQLPFTLQRDYISFGQDADDENAFFFKM